MLFSEYQINYSKLPAVFRRGTIFIRASEDIEVEVAYNKEEAKEEIDPKVKAEADFNQIVDLIKTSKT